MTGPRRTRTLLPAVIGAVSLLGLVALVLIVRSGGHRADGGVAAAPIAAGALRDGADPVLAPALDRPVQALDGDVAAPRAVPPGAALLIEDGLFAGVPRAWTVPLVLRGRVLDEGGVPLAGARITYLPDDTTRALLRQSAAGPQSEGDLDALLPGVVTEADGRFTLEAARGVGGIASEIFREAVQGPGLVVADPRSALYVHRLGSWAAGEVDVGTLVMSAGTVLTGRVRDAGGRPITGFDVQLAMQFADASVAGVAGDDQLPAPLRRATTDGSGTYEFRSLWAGSGRVSVATPGWRPVARDVPAWAAGAAIAAPDLIAERGGAVTGLVLTALGQPVTDARVFVLDQQNWGLRDDAAVARAWASLSAGNSRRGVPTTDAGRFVADGLDNTVHSVLAGAPGLRPAVLRDVWPDTEVPRLVLQPDAQYAEDATLALLVTDRDGAPLRAARVRATRRLPGATAARPLPVEDDGAGRFTISGAGAAPVEILALAHGFATTLASLSPAASGTTASPQVVPLAAEARVAGRVLDTAGLPVPAVAVTLIPAERPGDAGLHAHGTTGAAGRFSVAGLGAGPWRVAAFGEGVWQAAPLSVTLAEGERRDDLLLTVTQRGALQGRRHHRDCGAPSAPSLGNSLWSGDDVVTLSAVGADGVEERRRVPIRADGSFRVDGLVPGAYEVNAFPGIDTPAEVRGGETTIVDVLVPRPPVVRGRVLAGDEPAAGVRVTSESLSRRAARAIGVIACYEAEPETVVTDAQGRFTTTLLSQGHYAVWALSPAGGHGTEVNVALALDEEAEVELSLPSGRIEGDVVDAVTQAALGGVGVWSREGWVTTDAAGHFVMSQMPPGSHALWARADGYLVERLPPVELGADGTLTGLRFAMSRAARIDVTLLGPNGWPASGTRPVFLRPVDATRAQSSSAQVYATEGRAVFTDLVPGSYWIGVTDGTYPAGSGFEEPLFTGHLDVQLEAGESRAVELRVGAGP